jgi:hypothetical protein
MKNAEQFLDNEAEVLSFLGTRFPLYHLSNVFFRDLQYGIQTMLERRGVKVGYTDAERLAMDFAKRLEKKKMLVPIDKQSWVLYNEEYKTVSARKPAPAAKPAAEKPAAPRPSGNLPPLKSATPAAGAKPATGLPPLKSAPPAGGAKPAAGLPPLKSSAPTEKPAAQKSTPAQPEPAPGAEASPAPPPAAPPKPVPPKPAAAPSQGGLPPITSSVPVGKK